MASSQFCEATGEKLSNEIRQALSHQFNLETRIENLISDVQWGLCDANEILSKLLRAQENVKGVKAHFKRTLKPIYYNERRMQDSTIAERALNVPELLELVLVHVDFLDLLNMTQVSRTIRANMDGSPRLQKILCLKAAGPNDGILPCPFAGCVGEDSGFRFSEKKKQSTFTARFSLPYYRQLPAIGSLWRKRFICQPPVMRIEAYMTCCPLIRETSNGAVRRPIRTIDSETGITIGDLCDLVKELRVYHKRCEDSKVHFEACTKV